MSFPLRGTGPILPFHHFLNGDVGDIEVIADIGYLRSVGFEGFLGNDTCISNAGGGNDKGIGNRLASKPMSCSDESLEVRNGENLGNELGFLTPKGQEDTPVVIDPDSKLFAIRIVI